MTNEFSNYENKNEKTKKARKKMSNSRKGNRKQEKEQKMNNQIKRSKNSQKPVSKKLQLDMIELLGIVYQEGTKTIEDLGSIMSKSRSTIFRLLKGVICHVALTTKLDETFRNTKIKFTNKLSEFAIFSALATDKSTPLVSVFLMGVLRKEEDSFVRLAEIEEWLGCSAKEAIRVRNLIMSNSGLGEFEISDDDPWLYED